MISFLHAADLHLDSPFSGLPPEKAAQRRSEQREVLERLVSLAEPVDLVLLAGDLFDGEKTYYETVEALMQALGQMRAQVFIAPGNHDYYSARSLYERLVWPENVHIFRSGEIGRVELPRLGCAVYGAAFTGPSCETSLLRDFCAPKDGLLHLMALHGEVTGGAGSYNPISLEDISRSGLHYLALGHIHAYGGLKQAGDTRFAWPGCPQGRGFDETGPKGVLTGTLDETGANVAFVPTSRRNYEIYPVDLSAYETAEEALDKSLPSDMREEICRVVLTGESGESRMDLSALYSLLKNRCYHISLLDKTHIRRDIWARAGEDTLTGLFLRSLRAAYEHAESPEEQERVERAVRFGLAALECREDPYLT
ncbi:MAG: DNA repair exonuclease [Oscillospiraceae bacterium]|nr:DNA repair exonuclease [Oscillospiraceae bacterium]